MKGHYSDVWQAVARSLPDRPAIVTRTRTMHYRRFASEAAGLARHLHEIGVRPGDGVAIYSYNRPEYLVTLFACLASGFAPVPINFRYRSAEVADLLRGSGAAVIVHPTSLAAVVSAALCDLDASGHERPALIQIDDGGQGSPGAARYGDVVELDAELPEVVPAGGELRLYTGGTTGRPKAVVWGAEDILEVQLYSIYGTEGLERPQTMDDVVRIAADPSTPRVATLPLAPFMHGTALFTSMNTLVLGGTVIVHDSPHLDAGEALRLAVEKEATRIIVAGDAIALPIAEAAESAEPPGLGAVRSIISSGMRLSDTTKARLHALQSVVITDLLASTEGGPFAVGVTTGVEDLPARLRLLPGAVVLDEEREEVQDIAGAHGILAFRGALPRGYYRDEEKSRAAFPLIRGVRHVVPGDWVQVRGDGTVELLGRGSAVVNTGGEKVYPAEVEETLLSHPDVADAVVFGMPDSRFGELVTAVAVPREGRVLTEAALQEHVATMLAGYKKPRHIVIRPSLERSPHGKVDMMRLKETIAREIEAGKLS